MPGWSPALSTTPLNRDLALVDYSDTRVWKELGAAGAIYEWLGDTQEVNLGDPAYERWLAKC